MKERIAANFKHYILPVLPGEGVMVAVLKKAHDETLQRFVTASESGRTSCNYDDAWLWLIN